MNNSISQTSLRADLASYVRYQLRGRRGLIIVAVALGIPALWFGWPWLVVAGLAPLLIALAPCAIMCALGLCAMKAAGNANRGEPGSNNISRSETSCCSQSPLIDETVAVPGSKGGTDMPAEPVSLVVPFKSVSEAGSASRGKTQAS
jgi:hypothetical protein